MQFTEFSWSLAESLKLDGFLEKYNIPPIVIPLLFILLAALLIFFFLAAPSEEALPGFCGDGICDPLQNETIISCPEDCIVEAPELKTVSVEILGDLESRVDVLLENRDRQLVDSMGGTSSPFIFTRLDELQVMATVVNRLNGKSISSDFINLDIDDSILIGLPPGFFDSMPEGVDEKAVLKLIVKDSESGVLLPSTATISIPSGSSRIHVMSRSLAGADYITLSANQWYAVSVESPGYHPKDMISNPIYLDSGSERELIVLLEPMAFEEPYLLRVCTDGLSGFIKIHSLEGIELGSQALEDSCTEFELLPQTLVISTQGLPEGCMATSREFQLSSDAELMLNISCGQAGRVRVRAMDDGNILTQDASISAFHSNGDRIPGMASSTLSMGSEGYTEYISALGGVYFVVANLEGYRTYTSPTYEILANEERSITLELQPLPSSGQDFTFSGIVIPSPVKSGSQFSVSVARVVYGQTDITEFAEIGANFSDVGIELAGEPCRTINDSIAWRAICTAPIAPGDYDLVFTASYDGRRGSEVRSLKVLDEGSPYLFELIPYPSFSRQPPILLEFDILFNSSPLDSPSDSAVGVHYLDGGITLDMRPQLQGSGGAYSITINSPFPGKHLAELYLQKVVAGSIYEQNFSIEFVSEPSSLLLSSQQVINPRILEPGERFSVYVSITYANQPVAGLSNVYAIIGGQRARLTWDPQAQAYFRHYSGMGSEGIYPAKFEIGYQELGIMNFYVIDSSKSRSDECNINACGTRPEVRECVQKHRQESFYSQADTVACIELGWPISGTASIDHCLSITGNRGDWNNDCSISQVDISAMSDFINRVPDRVERNSYLGCGDMDRDGDVDNADLECLINVRSGKWIGDTGDGSCETAMTGGFCFDITLGIPGDFNGDGIFDSEDLAIMWQIKNAAASGVIPPQELIDVADFNGDRRITQSDLDCMASIADGLEIPISCLKVYNFGCPDITSPYFLRGDLNQDTALTEVDLLLLGWLVSGRVIVSDVFECADVNDDWVVTEDDYNCLEAQLDSDYVRMEQYCSPCFLEMQKLGRYGAEICNDGLDNNCNGRTDESCHCDASQSCSRLWDSDGLYTTNDFKLCRSFGWREWSPQSSSQSSGSGWGWYTNEEIQGACGGSGDWGRIQYCGGGERTCLFTYAEGFSMDFSLTEAYFIEQQLPEGTDYDSATDEQIEEIRNSDEYAMGIFWANHSSFGWDFAEGVIGPLGVLRNCGSTTSCPEGWVEVSTQEGGCCDRCSWYDLRSKRYSQCTLCRYQYDNCNSVSCGNSGTQIPDSGCGSNWPQTYTEVCPADGCYGPTTSTSRGEGYYDNRYNRYVIWKPISDADGKLVIFLEDAVGKNIDKAIVAKDPNARFGILDEGRRVSDYSGWPHFRFNRPGIYYGTCYLIIIYDEEGFYNNPVHVPYGSKYEDEYRLIYHILTGASRYATR